MAVHGVATENLRSSASYLWVPSMCRLATVAKCARRLRNCEDGGAYTTEVKGHAYARHPCEGPQ